MKSIPNLIYITHICCEIVNSLRVSLSNFILQCLSRVAITWPSHVVYLCCDGVVRLCEWVVCLRNPEVSRQQEVESRLLLGNQVLTSGQSVFDLHRRHRVACQLTVT